MTGHFGVSSLVANDPRLAHPEPLLDVANVSKLYGRLVALDAVSLSVYQGEIVGLIGPNGAGKTTLVGVLSGAIIPSSGSIRYRGNRIEGLPAHRFGTLGIIRTFQLVQPFSHLSVRECVMLGALFGSAEGRAESVRTARGDADEVLAYVGMKHKADLPASSLNIAERKRLEIARALAARPSFLLLDEVVAGLTNSEVNELVALIRLIRNGGVTILIIEHVMQAILQLADRVVVLNHGQKIAEGEVNDVLARPVISQAYFGRRSRPASVT